MRIGDFGLARVPEEEANTPMTGYGKSFFLKQIRFESKLFQSVHDGIVHLN
jgi:hypothetical protein